MRALILSVPAKRWRFMLAILLLGAAAWAGYYLWLQPAVLMPASELVEKAVHQTADTPSYRYTLLATLEVDGRTQIWSDIAGERSNQDVHIVGRMLSTPVEMYQVGKTSYNRDPFTNKWYIVEGYDLNEQTILMMEINPLSNLNFKAVVEAEYAGREKVKGKDCWVINCRPDLENQLLEVLWQDFRYQLWIDRREGLIRKAVMEAKSRNSTTSSLKITMEIFDFNQPINITPPQ